MTSSFFNINKYIVLEYIYDNSIISTSNVNFRRIINSNDDIKPITIINDNNSKTITKNVIDNTVVKNSDGKYVLLDIDGPYFYPNLDPSITDTAINIPISKNVTYDKIRIHILSGYQFQDLKGFICSIYCKLANNKSVNLCNISYTRSDTDLLYFNPHPVKMSEFIYDKYVEILIPSHNKMLLEQIAFPGNLNNLAYILSNGLTLANQNTIYCEYHNITNIDTDNTITYFDTDEAVRFSFNSFDLFGLLVANIKEASDGNYFELYGEYDSKSIEDFIYTLNSVAGNKFYLIHDINIVEQIGQSFIRTQSYNTIQTDNYNKSIKIRPVLDNPSSISSFSIEYTLRLYNSVDGKAIFKTSTLTISDSSKIQIYSKKGGLMLNVGNSTNPIKVYNKVSGSPVFNITDNLTEITKSKILTVYQNVNEILVRSDSDIDKTVDILLKVNPFDNLFKFDLIITDTQDDNTHKELDISSLSDYFIVFIKNDGSKNYIQEFVSQEFIKSRGELAFKLSKNQSEEIIKYNNNKFYVIAKNKDGLESVVFDGKWTS